MPIELTKEAARRIRLRAQNLLNDDGGSTISGLVRDCCGLQAQDARQAPFSVRARGSAVTATDLDQARFEDRSITRTWCMRGTLHYVSTDDLSWVLSLFGELYVSRGQRRLTQLGLDEHDCEQALEVIHDSLASDGPHTREEVTTLLLGAGFEFDPDGQAPVHIVRRACLEGVAIEAAPRAGKETYALLDDWVSLESPPDREDAVAALAHRYLAANEPATPEDFYDWSGLYKRDVRTGWTAIESKLSEVIIDGERAWTLTSPDDFEFDEATSVRLLPMYDSYFLGHEDRELVVPPEYAKRIYPGGGVIRSTVVVDGVAAGTWTLDRSGPIADLVVTPFEPFDADVQAGVEAEVEDIGRFLSTDIEYRVDEPG